MVAIVTREVPKQLCEDRDAGLPPPSLPAPVMPVTAPLYLTVTGALSSTVDTDGYPSEPTPSSVPMHTTPLGADLSDKLKTKIWANEFVDFLDLTHPIQQQPQQTSVQSGSSPSCPGLLPCSCLGLARVWGSIHPVCSRYLQIRRNCAQHWADRAAICLVAIRQPLPYPSPV